MKNHSPIDYTVLGFFNVITYGTTYLVLSFKHHLAEFNLKGIQKYTSNFRVLKFFTLLFCGRIFVKESFNIRKEEVKSLTRMNDKQFKIISSLLSSYPTAYLSYQIYKYRNPCVWYTQGGIAVIATVFLLTDIKS